MAEVETSREGGVLTITLNRPEVLNAFNAAMHGALQAAFKQAPVRLRKIVNVDLYVVPIIGRYRLARFAKDELLADADADTCERDAIRRGFESAGC